MDWRRVSVLRSIDERVSRRLLSGPPGLQKERHHAFGLVLILMAAVRPLFQTRVTHAV
jgi:hypothetical protein